MDGIGGGIIVATGDGIAAIGTVTVTGERRSFTETGPH
jgi:hypothetical protein